MATKVADRVVLDTNVLLAATDTGHAEYARARAALDEWPARGTTLYTSGQILREYLAVASRPEKQNGLGLSQADAVGNVSALAERMRLLTENEKVHTRLLELVSSVDCAGKQVHDANIVATMLAHGVNALVTSNISDFTRFDGRVQVLTL